LHRDDPHAGAGWAAYGCGAQSASATFTVLAPTLSVTPTWGFQNTPVTVNGYTFAALGYASVYVDGAYQTQRLTDEGGNFTASFTMPSLALGPHTIMGLGGQTASATFFVTTNIGTAGNLTNPATITHPGGQPVPLQPGMTLYLGDSVQTGAGGRLNVTLVDGTQFIMGENSRLTMDNYIYDPDNSANNSALYSLLNSSFRYISGAITKTPNPNVDLYTTVGAIGIRGTEFNSQQDPCSSATAIYLIEGELAVTPTNTPGVTNILDAPVSILLTSNSITTNTLTQDQYNSISNGLFAAAGPVTYGSWATQYFGCTNNNPAALPDADPDGDGVSNWNEFLAGTDPTTNASAFRILTAVPSGTGMMITWTCGGGRTNILQSASALNGSWSGIFTNVFPSGGDGTTNYLDTGTLGGASATKYYRVLLGQ
jgi:hypothetical protein